MDNPASLFQTIPMGIGTWAWGDRLIWGYGDTYQKTDLKESFDYCVDHGVTFFDTAEGYGQGRSEGILGEFQKSSERPIAVATKFMPYPWRLGKGSLLSALSGSLKRLQTQRVDLYQVHMPLPPVNIETWMQAMAEAVLRGFIRWVGVSNFDRAQTQRAYEALKREGITLTSNQVEYNLLDRRVEKNGLLEFCKELGVTVIAYSPLAMGVLTGKYHPGYPMKGIRGAQYNQGYLGRVQPLLQLMRKIGNSHEKTTTQVAINWTICKGAYPIPGIKNIHQAEQALGSFGWQLTEEEIAALDRMSDQI